MAQLLARIGGFSARHRWAVVVVWTVLLVAAAAGAKILSQPMSSEFTISGLQSVHALNDIKAQFPAAGASGGDIVFAAPENKKLTATDKSDVANLTSVVSRIPGIASATNPFTAKTPTLSPDGRIGYIPIALSTQSASASTKASISDAMDRARSDDLQVEATAKLATEKTASNAGQLIGIVLALVILLMTFGSFLAAGLPLVSALLGLVVGISGIYATTSLVTINSVAPSLALLLALAVGIDYSLFIVDRHRRQMLDGMRVLASIRRAMGTAGSAVFFAGSTVVIALAALSIVRIDFLTQMGLAGAGGVLVAIIVALTLTPALLSIIGTRIVPRRILDRASQTERPAKRTPARRWARLVTARPVIAMIASVVVLVGLGIPVLSLQLGLPNGGTQASSTTDRKAFDLLSSGFGAGANAPILVLAEYNTTSPTRADIDALTQTISGVADVDRAVLSGVTNSAVLLTVVPQSGPSDSRTETLISRLAESELIQGEPGVSTLRVSGETTVAIDVSDQLRNALPLYLGLIATFALLLLLVAFRSIVIPIKAIVSFLLSLGASLGATVAVFQWGWLSLAFPVDSAGPLLSFLPIIVIGVLFGLSMDYEMFLVSGIREEHSRGFSPRDAIVGGISLNAKVVAAAALIMIGVFGAGIYTSSTLIKPIAFALAIGVLVDAFVVRMTLVPAVMALFGRHAWWLPRWMARALPNVDLEGENIDKETEEVAVA